MNLAGGEDFPLFSAQTGTVLARGDEDGGIKSFRRLEAADEERSTVLPELQWSRSDRTVMLELWEVLNVWKSVTALQQRATGIISRAGLRF